MGIFSFLNKAPQTATAAVDTPETGTTGNRLILFTTPVGWRSGMLQADGSLTDLKAGDSVLLEGEGWKRTEIILKEAVAANAKSLKQAKTISLLLDDYSVQVTDNRPAALVAASGATVRQYGKQWLNVKDVTYGYADLPPIAGEVERKQKDGVYAFIDVQRMRDYLAVLDKEGIKVTEVVPSEYLMVHRAVHSSEPVYGALRMSGHSSTLVLINHELGIVQVRKIPVGFLTLVQSVARTMGVPVQDAVQAMAQRDLAAEVVPIAPGSMDSMVAMQNRSLQFQALQPPLTRLLDDIKEFLAFFSFQKVAGVPGHLELYGAIDRVLGLPEWLSQHSGVPMVIRQQPMLELFAEAEHPMACNLLKGAESSLLTVGRTRFFFTEDKGFISGQELATRGIQGSVARADAQPASPAETRRRSGRGTGSRSRRDKKETGQGGLAALLARLKIGPAATSDFSVAGEQTKDQQFTLLFACLVAGILYWGYTEYDTLNKKYQAQASAYLATTTENNELIKKIRHQETAIKKMGAATDTTKIFWSEKFLALASNMTKHIWLSDVYLTEEDRSVAGSKTKGKTMVIEGNVLPSTDGHVQIIAEYIDHLLHDQEWFMSDFRDVIFRGAEFEGDSADNPSGDPKIHFTLRALYDKNKRIESKKQGTDKKPTEPGATHDNTDRHNQQLEDVLSGKKGE
ncbi:MAG: hypothetical protein HQL87_00740 [Magnetococcales bacterium]|nr:hypothetical protein [Magnetococcales bacterium]